jgi:hypothetical protein
VPKKKGKPKRKAPFLDVDTIDIERTKASLEAMSAFAPTEIDIEKTKAAMELAVRALATPIEPLLIPVINSPSLLKPGQKPGDPIDWQYTKRRLVKGRAFGIRTEDEVDLLPLGQSIRLLEEWDRKTVKYEDVLEAEHTAQDEREQLQAAIPIIELLKKPWLKVSDVAKVVGISEHRVRKLMQAGVLTSKPSGLGRAKLISRESMFAYIGWRKP